MFSPTEKEAIKKYFGKYPDALDPESLKSLLRQLRAKYHPDNFEKFEDETVREMATDRFQQIEALAAKLEDYHKGNRSSDFRHADAIFAIRKLKVEVLTADKDLKYHLFGTFYRWLVNGDSYKIPETKASIIIDENHRGMRIGFQETIRMYLTFDEDDSIEVIVNWLFPRIQGRADSIMIKGERVDLDYQSIVDAIKQESFLRIAAPGPG